MFFSCFFIRKSSLTSCKQQMRLKKKICIFVPKLFINVVILNQFLKIEKISYIILSMKQEIDLSTLLELSESGSSKVDKNQRKKPIKKDAMAAELKKQRKLVRLAKKQLSKEEKIRLQKEKNRFHAQKSRDQHKQYVNGLEREVTMLRQQLQRSKNYCCSCRKAIIPNEYKHEIVEEKINLQHFNQDEISWKQENFDMNEVVTEKGDSASFLRLFQEKQDHHLLKMILFIVAIVIAVLFVNGPMTNHHQPKTIMMSTVRSYTISQEIQHTLKSNDTLQNSLIQPKEHENHQKLNLIQGLIQQQFVKQKQNGDIKDMMLNYAQIVGEQAHKQDRQVNVISNSQNNLGYIEKQAK